MERRRWFRALCLLCLLCGVLAERNVSRKNDESFPAADEEPIADPAETHEDVSPIDRPISPDKLRDKRALGLILSGLAQVFGYTVSPVQLASLPIADSAGGGTANQSPSQSPPPAGPVPASSVRPAPSTAAPRRRETIRFTGVVNFGNSTNLLDHLRQYERTFHGPATTAAPAVPATPATAGAATAPAAPATPSTSMTAPAPATGANHSTGTRISPDDKPPLLSPLLVQIPIPIAPNLPPVMIAHADEKLAYPTPMRQEMETVYTRNENVENYSVEDKEIHDEKEVRRPGSGKYSEEAAHEDEPQWKKDYEERLAQLERRQKEHAERLRQQEEQSSRERINQSREEEIADRGREHASGFREEDRGEYKGDEDSGEYEGSREKQRENFDRKQPQKHPAKDYTEGSRTKPKEEDAESDEEDADDPRGGARFNQQLPISDYYQRQRPDKLRDSYGAVLNDDGLVDERLANYFSKLREQQDEAHDADGARSPEESDDAAEREEEPAREDPLAKIRQEYALPAALSKYEEYDVDKDEPTRQNGKNGSLKVQDDRDDEEDPRQAHEPAREPDRGEYNDYESNSEKDEEGQGEEYRRNDSSEQRAVGRKPVEAHANSGPADQRGRYDFVTLSPYIVPIRYLYAPEQLELARANSAGGEKLDEYGSAEGAKGTNRSRVKQSSGEDLQPNVGLPERISEKKLHEGEGKEHRVWPAPFDYAFDSTEQTNVVTPNEQHRQIDGKVGSGQYRKPSVEASRQRDEDRRLAPLDTPPRQYEDYRETVGRYYDEDPEQRTYVERQQGAAGVQALNRQQPTPNEDVTRPHQQHQQHEQHQQHQQHQEHQRQLPDFYDRYRYATFQNHDGQIAQIPGVELGGSHPAQLPAIGGHHPLVTIARGSELDNPSQGYLPRLDYPAQNDNQPIVVYDYYNPLLLVSDRRSSVVNRAAGLSQRSLPKNERNVSKEETEEEELIVPEPTPYPYDERITDASDDPDTNKGKVNVSEYRNKVATLRVSERKQIEPNGPIRHTGIIRNL